MKRKSVRNYWDDAAEAWADFVRTGKDYSRDEVNNPAMFRMMGNIRGKRILDLGCGEGYNSRIMARKGAKVMGIDFSKKMIDFAIREEKTKKLGIDYHVSDVNNLRMFKSSSFDIVACFMALQDIEDYRRAIKETHRVLKKHGRFVFGIPHPCFEARLRGKKFADGWVFRKGAKDRSSENALYFKVDRYLDTHRYVILWIMERLEKQFKTTSFHRTLTDYADALCSAGFLISRLNEPTPTKRGMVKYPSLKKGLRIPQSIIIEAVKR